MTRFLDLVSLVSLRDIRRACAVASVAAGLWLPPASLAHAASLETQNNPVPNGVMQMNGDYSKWLSVPQYQLDAVGDGASGGLADGVDIAVGAVAHDEGQTGEPLVLDHLVDLLARGGKLGDRADREDQRHQKHARAEEADPLAGGREMMAVLVVAVSVSVRSLAEFRLQGVGLGDR